MITLLASAKTLDFTTPWPELKPTQPEFASEARALVTRLRPFTAVQLAHLMGVNAKLAQLNVERFQQFHATHTPEWAKPALLAYQGDMYEAMGSADLTEAQLAFAQQHLRILSGLYGVLRPLDLIQPYRLEMAIKLSGSTWRDLYAFWSDKVTAAIDRDVRRLGGVVVNLASQEYAQTLQRARLQARWLNITFKQQRAGKIETVPILAKRARGLMARYLLDRQISEPAGLKGFDTDGYRFAAAASNDAEWVFVRPRA